MKLKVLAALVLTLFLFNSSLALYGTRPMGMGGAFTAVADDANAAYWNPAGFAINPGVDITGSLLATNRNESIGDNIASLKMCFETELNPFAWIIGIGAASLFALEGAKYLSDQGILKKNWGRSEETSKKEESLSQKVLESGTEKTVAVGQKVKEKAAQVAGAAAQGAIDTTKAVGKTFVKEFARESAREAYWGPWYYPWYYHHYDRPTYWDNRQEEGYSPQGKAQFAAGLTLLTDKNSIANQNTNFYTLSLATGYEERISFGGNLNFYDITIPSPNNIKGYGGGIDLGVLIRPVDQLAFGAVAKEVLTTDVRFENGAIIRFPMSVNAGIAITPIEIITIAADLQNVFKQSNSPQTTHFGVEARIFPGLALRGGLYDQSKTAGASVMVGPLIFDYAYLGGEFNRTQMIGATWKL